MKRYIVPVRLLELLFAAVFIYAGVLKIADPVGFARDIENYKLLPWSLSLAAGFYLPWLEVFCGLTIVLRRLYFGGLSMLTGLIGIFIFASVIAKARGLDITCGCFGHAARNLSFAGHLAIDLAILAVAIVLWRFRFSRTVRV